MHDKNPEDPAMMKAIKAMTKTMEKSMNCNPHTIQSQMHNFGKGGAGSRKTKKGRIINPNPPAISARQAPGRGPAPLGRRLKDRSGETLEIATAGGNVTVRPDNPPHNVRRRPHNFTYAVENNLPGAR